MAVREKVVREGGVATGVWEVILCFEMRVGGWRWGCCGGKGGGDWGGLEGTCVCVGVGVLRDLVDRGGEEIRKVSG